jgi:hypothetical protein
VRENLFASLEREIAIALLFLQNVKRIRIEELPEVNPLEGRPKTVLRTDVRRQEDRDMTFIVDAVTGRETKFLVHTLSAADLPSHPRAELEALATKLRVPTKVSVAACLSGTGPEEQFHDRVSVMLPLPALPSTKTGLPVVVNAFFALGESRYVETT